MQTFVALFLAVIASPTIASNVVDLDKSNFDNVTSNARTQIRKNPDSPVY